MEVDKTQPAGVEVFVRHNDRTHNASMMTKQLQERKNKEQIVDVTCKHIDHGMIHCLHGLQGVDGFLDREYFWLSGNIGSI